MPARHPLLGLLVAQFLGAFNDNAFKLLVTLLGIRAASAAAGLAPGAAEYDRLAQAQTTMAFVVLTLPLALFSLPAGALADRVSKRALIVALKGLEVVLMLAAALAFAYAPTGHWSLLALLGAMGLQSALFSPAKYGILPDLVAHEKLSSSNGLLETWSFLGIVLGTVAGGLLVKLGDAQGLWLPGLTLAVLAFVGFVASFWVPAVPAASEARPALESLRGAWRVLWRDRTLRLAVLGLAAYWGAASLLGQDVLVYGKSVLGLADADAPIPLGAFAIGVAGGAVLAGRLSAGKVERGLIPLGALGVAAAAIWLGAVAPGFFGTTVAMVVMGVCSGLVLVPLNALLQWRAPASRRGAVIALANVLAFSAILGGSLVADGLSRAGLDSRAILLGSGGVAALGTLWALWLLPDAFLRLVAFLLTRSIYQLDVQGRAQVPATGPAILAPNHVSFMDGMFVMTSLDRPVRFLVDKAYFDHWLLKPFMRALGFIPVQAGSGRDSVHRSLSAAREYLQKGELVCIFPEGEISRTGGMLPFRRGIQRIVEGTGVPIVPVHLDRVWGSVFSFSGGRFLLKWPKRAPYPITVSFGAPLPSDAPLHAVRGAVQGLGVQAWLQRRQVGTPLVLAAARRARRAPLAAWLLGRQRGRVNRGRALLEAVRLARALGPRWRGHERVALLFPTSSAGALAAWAVALTGKTAVWLDPAADDATWRAQAQRAGAAALLTSRAWLDETKRSAPALAVLDEIERARMLGWTARAAARAVAMLGFGKLLLRGCGATRAPAPDDIAAVVFAAGEPVSLTWGGLGAQVAGLAQVLPYGAGDRAASSFGLHTAIGQLVLWATAARGLGWVLASGDDAASLGRALTKYAADLLVTEPARLNALTVGCRPGQLGSLQCVLSLGVAHDPAHLEAFEAQFGLRPLPGLARADLGPLVTLSSSGFRAAGFYQLGARRGYLGHPLPGVSVRVLSQGAELAPEQAGELWLRGPSVLAADGEWRQTGLRGCVDGNGYVGLVPTPSGSATPRR
jgi:acyl-[acyl-carrier-protein]-phospholipid O-acyltransferase/long-chain-fatty-acid--[acyl-carrier-protein] ligase